MGLDFLRSLPLQWDLETDFSFYHDVSEEEKKIGFCWREHSCEMLKFATASPNSWSENNTWNGTHDTNVAGIIYAVLNNVPLTPPLVTPDESHQCIFLNSGFNRFAVGLLNHSKRMPVLIRANEVNLFDKLIERKLSQFSK